MMLLVRIVLIIDRRQKTVLDVLSLLMHHLTYLQFGLPWQTMNTIPICMIRMGLFVE